METMTKLRMTFFNDSFQGFNISFGLTANFEKWKPDLLFYYITYFSSMDIIFQDCTWLAVTSNGILWIGKLLS